MIISHLFTCSRLLKTFFLQPFFKNSQGMIIKKIQAESLVFSLQFLHNKASPLISSDILGSFLPPPQKKKKSDIIYAHSLSVLSTFIWNSKVRMCGVVGFVPLLPKSNHIFLSTYRRFQPLHNYVLQLRSILCSVTVLAHTQYILYFLYFYIRGLTQAGYILL